MSRPTPAAGAKSAAAASAPSGASGSPAAAGAAGAVESLLPLLSRGSPSATLRALLGLPLPSFFARHWERAPLHVSRSAPHFYRGLFAKARVDAHVRERAAQLQYGFDINLCVCSKEGKKVDKNPRKHKGGAQRAALAPASAPAPASNGTRKAAAAPGGKRPPPSRQEEDGEEETMSIADALRLAAQQKSALGNRAAAESEEEEEADEDGEEEGEEAEEGEESSDEELLDGTSVSTIRQYAPVRFDDYDRLYREGCTVQALQPQHYHEPMRQLVTQLEQLFGGLVGANCYLTPPRSQGLAPHYDDVDVFVLQLEGSKSWRLYHPQRTLPREHSGDFARDEIGEPFQELDLLPGDLMYLPRGVIHEARTSDEASAHMTISVYQKTAWFDLLTQLFPMALTAAFESDDTEAFRKGLPLNYLAYMGSGDAMAEQLRSDKQMTIIDDDATSAEGEPLSAAEPTRTRSQLREDMKAQLRALLTQLQPILEANLDACADEMSRDFMQSRLPPLEASSSAAAPAAPANPFQLSPGGALGAPPQASSLVRLRHPSAVRMIVVPGDEADDQEEDDEEGGFGGAPHLLLTHSLHNDATHHLDGRHPPDPEAIAAAQLQLPLYYAPAVLQLLRSRQSLSVDSLRLDLDDMLNADGDAPSAEEQTAARMELAVSLWQARLLDVVDPHAPAPAASKKAKRGASMQQPQKQRRVTEPPNKKQKQHK